MRSDPSCVCRPGIEALTQLLSTCKPATAQEASLYPVSCSPFDDWLASRGLKGKPLAGAPDPDQEVPDVL